MRAVGGRDVRGSDVEQDDWGLEVRPVVVVSAELLVCAVWCPRNKEDITQNAKKKVW